MSKINLIHFEVLNDLLLLQWDNKSENALPLKPLRDNCPCAHCSGETDVFGNIYKGPPQTMKEESYQIKLKILIYTIKIYVLNCLFILILKLKILLLYKTQIKMVIL